MLGWIRRSLRRYTLGRHRLQDFLLAVDKGERRLGLIPRTALRLGRLAWHAGRGFWYDDGFSRSAALAYSFLCSMVPVAVLVLYAILHPQLPGPVHDYAEQAMAYVQKLLVPERAQEAVAYMKELQEKLAQARDPLGFLGFGFLLVIAWSLLNTLEGAMNCVWKVRDPRLRLGKVPIYLLTLCAGAALIGVLQQLPLPELVADALRWVLPFLIVATLFFLILYLVPNTDVDLLPAVAVALLAAGAWFLMKAGFDLYLERFLTYDKIFGAIGLIPVILLWIYLTWCLVLFGGELTYVARHFQAVADHRFRIVVRSRFFREYLSLRILLAIGRREGQPVRLRQLRREIPVPEAELREELMRLRRDGLVGRRLLAGFRLQRPAGQIQLRRLLHLGRQALEQLTLIEDPSPEGRFCLDLIGRIVAGASAAPGRSTLEDALAGLRAGRNPEPAG